VLRRVVDLRHVNHAGRAHIDHAERGGQHADIGILWCVGRRYLADDVTVVVRIDAAIRQDVAQDALIGMAVGIDEAWNDDSV
jgi:Ser-tRNA(Ala) deacylase AlaX